MSDENIIKTPLIGQLNNEVVETGNYNKLENKPKINNVELVDNVSLDNLGIQPKGNYALESDIPEPYDDSEIKKDIENLQKNKANSSDIPDVSNFITNTVDNLVNYYKKSETYTQEEVNTLIGNLHSISILFVDTLPTTGETNIIYLVPRAKPEEGNVKDEYIYVNNSWEKIGSTDIDLSGYVTIEYLTNTLNNYVTTQYLNNQKYIKNNASDQQAIAIGQSATSQEDAITIGAQAQSNGAYAVTLGHLAKSPTGAITIGAYSRTGEFAMAIGNNSSSMYPGSIALGDGTSTTKMAQMMIGSDDSPIDSIDVQTNTGQKTVAFTSDIDEKIGNINTILSTLTTVSEVQNDNN